MPPAMHRLWHAARAPLPPAGERKSKRSRKGRVALRVSNTTTLQQLKLELWQSLAVHPKNQMVRGVGGQAAAGRCMSRGLRKRGRQKLPGHHQAG